MKNFVLFVRKSHSPGSAKNNILAWLKRNKFIGVKALDYYKKERENNMKVLILSFTILLLLTGCKKSIVTSNSDEPGKIIAFQPLDDFNIVEFDSLVNEISRFYRKRIIILKAVNIPLTFIDPETKMYSGDSILMLLSKVANDTMVEIAGLTNRPIFAVKETSSVPYYDDTIFGMSHEPGNSCVVSDHRLKTGNKRVFHNRLKNVIIHEVGHNLGLSHCEDNKCIMSNTNGHFNKLDIKGKGYCRKCNGKLTPLNYFVGLQWF